ALDTSFNSTGTQPGFNIFDVTGKNLNDNANGLAIDRDGRIVVVGEIGTAGAEGAEVARLIGTVEKPRNLLVGGAANGTAVAFASDQATGQYNTTPFFNGNPLGTFAGNVRVAVGDVNGDGFEDGIAVTGPGPAIRFAVVSGKDGTTVLVPPTAPFAGSEGFTGGGFVASADIDQDGRAEIIVTPDRGGGPRVTV